MITKRQRVNLFGRMHSLARRVGVARMPQPGSITLALCRVVVKETRGPSTPTQVTVLHVLVCGAYMIRADVPDPFTLRRAMTVVLEFSKILTSTVRNPSSFPSGGKI